MMKAARIIAAILIVPAAYILQTTLFQAIRIGSIIPDVILVITVALALTKGEVYAILTGFFMGLLCDIFSMDLIGSMRFSILLPVFFAPDWAGTCISTI